MLNDKENSQLVATKSAAHTFSVALSPAISRADGGKRIVIHKKFPNFVKRIFIHFAHSAIHFQLIVVLGNIVVVISQ